MDERPDSGSEFEVKNLNEKPEVIVEKYGSNFEYNFYIQLLVISTPHHKTNTFRRKTN